MAWLEGRERHIKELIKNKYKLVFGGDGDGEQIDECDKDDEGDLNLVAQVEHIARAIVAERKRK